FDLEMRGPRRTGPAALILMLSVCAACSARRLQLGTGTLDGGPMFEVGPMVDGVAMVDNTDAHPPDVATVPSSDPPESGCVIAAVQLPWAQLPAPTRLEIAATADAVAVISRQAKQADVRTYARDGTVISGYQFAAEAQVLPYDARRFLLVA